MGESKEYKKGDIEICPIHWTSKSLTEGPDGKEFWICMKCEITRLELNKPKRDL